MLILASVSPRRRDLLARLDLPFKVVAPRVDEGVLRGRPEPIARRLAAAKAHAVAAERPDAAVLAADTVVAYGSILLGKPTNADEAQAMLQRLRLWRTHRVVTAVAALPPARTGARLGGRRRPRIAHATTYVTMRRYTDADIAASIARGDPSTRPAPTPSRTNGWPPWRGTTPCLGRVSAGLSAPAVRAATAT